jgi:hypothetical protein
MVSLAGTLLSNEDWLASRPNTSFVVQIGANDHGEGGVSARQDLVMRCIRHGWKALLFEPVPHIYVRLEARYRVSRRVRTRSMAICPQQPKARCLNAKLKTVGGARSRGAVRTCFERARAIKPWGSPQCLNTTLTMAYLDVTNATGNWGSDHADARCITGNGRRGARYHFLLELSSFSIDHPLKHYGPGIAPATCMDCSKKFGRKLPYSCLSEVVKRNLRFVEVECACLSDELAGERRVDLLFVDAEGVY